MAFLRQVSRLLDDDHRALLDLLGRAEQAFARPPSDSQAGAALVPLLRQLAQQTAHDIGHHFDFEEHALFPRLVDAGDAGMAGLLTDEHAVIREVAAELLPLTQAAVAGTLDAAGWRTLSLGTLELVERQVSHIQKETMALLPLLDDMLDDDTDQQLALAFAEA
jgi:hemerythrin-like domain-containing protein